jgi:hypothetical protein
MVWKILFWLYALIIVLSTAYALNETNWYMVDYIEMVATILAALCMYGYAYQKVWGTQAQRQLFIVSVVGYLLLYFLYLDLRYGAHPAESLSSGVLTVVFLSPLLISNILYARLQR